MKRKTILFIGMIGICACMTGCNSNRHDYVEVYNKSKFVFDNITIETKDGYFYDTHEKFTVDDDTIAVTIYFSTKEDDAWK